MNLRILTPILLATCVTLASAGEPTSPVERFQRALTLEESKGDPESALPIYRDLVAKPDTPAGLRVRAELRIAACCERLGRVEEARKRYAELQGREKTWKSVAKAARAGTRRLEVASDEEESYQLPKGWLSSWDPKTRRLSFSVEDVDVRTLLCRLAEIGGLDMVLAPAVTGSVTTKLQGVSPRSALEAIVETVGDYALIEVDQILRVVAKSSLENHLVTEVYRLHPKATNLRAQLASAKTPESMARAAAALVAHDERHKSLYRVVSELLTTSAVPGAWAGYDAGTESIFVRCGRDGHIAVRQALAKDLATASPSSSRIGAGPLVSLQVEDASITYALTTLAKAASSPLILGPVVTGTTSLVLNKVPFDSALRAVTETTGDYLVVQTPIGPRVTTRSASEGRTSVRRWPLKGDAPTFWRRAQGASWYQAPGRWPGHPLTKLLSDLITNSGEAGAALQYDPGSHALLSCLSEGLAADLRQALEAAGYLEPRPRKVLTSDGRFMRVNLPALLQRLATQNGVNVILSPLVRGQASLILPKEAAAFDLLEHVAAGTGDFLVETVSPKLFRVTSRDQHKVGSLSTEVVPIPAGHFAPMDLFAAASELVTAGQIPGSSVLSSRAADGAWSLVVTLHARELAVLKQIVGESVPAPSFTKAMAGQTVLVPAKTHCQVFTIQPGGSPLVQLVTLPTAPGELKPLADGWSARLLPDGDEPYLLVLEKGKERRVQRSTLLPKRDR